jgi:hypothetical protein
MSDVRSNYAFERALTHGGPLPGCPPAVGRLCMRQAVSRPAALLGR